MIKRTGNSSLIHGECGIISTKITVSVQGIKVQSWPIRPQGELNR